MVTGMARAPYPGGLTNRLPTAHPALNAVRKTLHHSRIAGSNARESDLTPVAANEPVRTALRALVLAAAFATLLVVAAPAGAAQSCGRAVIDDWYDDGRVDGTYALHCYDDAIEILPRDVRDYSSAKEDIQRALQNRKRGEPAPPATTDPTPGDDGGSSSGGGGGTGGDDGSGTPGTETTPTETTGPTDGDEQTGVEAAGPTDTDSASSVPIPLLILAGLALLLVAGGSAGYLIRRLQARRLPPPAV
jgi:cobalamin biosynthesis Mg chelatase CobN